VGTLHGSLGCDSPPKPVSLGARFWGFQCSRVGGGLGGISSIPIVWTSFGLIKLGYGLLMMCSYCPQSLVQAYGTIREIKAWMWRCWPAGAVHPEKPGCVRCCPVLQLFRVWVSLELG
jgi:hypothetical protein